MNDLKYAIRQLINHPGFTIVAMLVLALCIGVNSAVVSVVKDVIFDPLPQKDADRLMYLHVHNPGRSLARGVSSDYWEELRSAESLFENLVSYDDDFRLNLEGGDFVERIKGSRVMPSFFRLLGTRPQLGRVFSPDEATPGNDRKILLSHGFWQRQYGGDSNVVGQSIILSKAAYTVIGVMPRHFEFPMGGGQFWVPMAEPRPLPLPAGTMSMGISISGAWPVMFRLRDGVAVARVQTLLETLNQRYLQDSKTINEGWITEVHPLRHRFSDANLRMAFYGIMVAVLFVLLIGCSNLASLLLSRFESRRNEIAIRQALGAQRLRLIRQLMAESLLISVLGAVVGLVVAYWSIRVMVALVPAQMPRMKEVRLDLVTVMTSMGLCLGVGVLTGLIPAIEATQQTIGGVLKEAANSLGLDVRRRLFRHGQVILQLSLTLVLLAGAGLMIQSMLALLNVDLGFETENLVRVEFELPDDLKAREGQVRRNTIFSQIEARYETLPGVKSAAFYGGGMTMDYLPEGAEHPVNAQSWLCRAEDSGFFSTLEAPLVRGRYLSRADAEGAGAASAMKSVVINETMARLCWPDQDPIGKRFGPYFGRSVGTFEFVGVVPEFLKSELPQGVVPDFLKSGLPEGAQVTFSTRSSHRVIGVVPDIKESSFEQEVKPCIYEPIQRSADVSRAGIMVRFSGNPILLLRPLREILAELGQGFGRPKITLMKDVLYDSTASHRVFLKYLAVFSVAGLLLSAVGLYGVLAYDVSRRTREIGIRMALGAERRHVLNMVMSQGARLVFIGLATGLVAAFFLTRFLQSQLFEVSPTDPAVFVSVALLLTAVAAAACLFPALRASRVNPMTALRTE